MKPFFRKLVRVTVAVGISALVGEGADAQLASEGIVRITKPKTSAVINQQQALPPQTFNQPTYSQYSTSQSVAAQLPAPQQVSQAPSVLPPLHSTPTQPVQATQSARPIQQASAIRQVHPVSGGGFYDGDDVFDDGICDPFGGFGRGGCGRGGCGLGGCNSKDAMCDYFKSKFGYCIPSGAGGAGVPWVGKYSRVYPQDPSHFDQRDGQAWGAQGYGAPVAVPLAPVVGHTFNYGWGIPSSRLTPVSHAAY